jgi:hypothetical protein
MLQREGRGGGLLFLAAELAGGADRVPDVPLVEADLLTGDGVGDFVFNAGEVDQAGGDFDGAFG